MPEPWHCLHRAWPRSMCLMFLFLLYWTNLYVNIRTWKLKYIATVGASVKKSSFFFWLLNLCNMKIACPYTSCSCTPCTITCRYKEPLCSSFGSSSVSPQWRLNGAKWNPIAPLFTPHSWCWEKILSPCVSHSRSFLMNGQFSHLCQRFLCEPGSDYLPGLYSMPDGGTAGNVDASQLPSPRLHPELRLLSVGIFTLGPRDCFRKSGSFWLARTQLFHAQCTGKGDLKNNTVYTWVQIKSDMDNYHTWGWKWIDV